MNEERLIAERIAFWTAFKEAAPEIGIEPGGGWEKTIGLAIDGNVRVTLSLSQDKSSVYLVGRSDKARIWISANQDGIARRLRTTPGAASGEADKGRWFRKDNKKACFTVRRQWPEAIRWLRAQYATFSKAVQELEAGQ
ncbi:hypothetical protein ACFORG_13410 [Lutimaribacter marinistellae]|uniref:DUF4268 domain-containing protein n=1 Tax=Lutimaribacter marinistellae TaxID=1820329 RepID=A0ABV7TIN2_9RHOB